MQVFTEYDYVYVCFITDLSSKGFTVSSQDGGGGSDDPSADEMNSDSDENKLEHFKMFVTKRRRPLLPNFNTTKYIPSNAVLRYLDLFDNLLDILQTMHPKEIIDMLKSIMASKVHSISYFSTDFVQMLETVISSTSLLRVLFPYTNWYDHSIIRELAETSNFPESKKLLDEFDCRIDVTLPITSYPIPAPSELMVPDESSTHTVMAVKCKQYLPLLSLQDVGFVKSIMIEKFGVTEHAFVLVAVADHSSAMLFWLIPRSIVSLMIKATLEQSTSLYENGLLEIAIYPNFSFSTGNNNRIWTMAYYNDSAAMLENVSN